jgi:hypothetical protein
MRAQVAAADRKNAAPAADTKDQVAVRGKVLDAAGKPLAGASVAVVATLRTVGAMINGGGPLSTAEVLGQGKTDVEGRYTVRVARRLLERSYRVEVLAGGAGHAVGGQEVKKKSPPSDTDLRLEPAGSIKGRLIDLDGQPAAGVKVSVVRLGKLSYPAGRQYTMDADAIEPPPIWYNDFDRPPGKMEKNAPAVTTHVVQFDAPPEGLPLWPRPVVTDAQGRFTLHGLAKGEVVGVQIQDERYAAVNLELVPPIQGDTAVLAVGPPHLLEGTVTDAATGKPIAGARIHVDSFPDYFGGFGVVGEPADMKGRRGMAANFYVSMGPQISRSDCRTDEEGHYRMNPFQANTAVVTISGPPGQPYVTLRKNVGWPEGALRQKWNAALPRGVEVRGRVEDDAGTPVADCRLDLWSKDHKPSSAFGTVPQTRVLFPRRVQTAPDGSFRAVLPPGKWHLLANAPKGKYVTEKLAVKDITVIELPKNAPPVVQRGDGHFHPDGYAAVDVKAGTDVTGVKIVLRRAEK